VQPRREAPPAVTSSDGHEHVVDVDPSELVRREEWRRILTGTDPAMLRLRRLWRTIPSSPRCKLCAAPFKGPGAALTRLVMHGRSNANPLMCNACYGSLGKQPGGAEIDATILFADIRGSTGLAEQTGAATFRRLLQEFYAATTDAVERNGGFVDKLMGDGVMALFIPVFSGEAHAGRAIAAGADILAGGTARSALAAAGVGIGVGIQTGPAFVGAIGAGDRLDFTALGDTVNVAARLGSVAGPGEMLVGATTWDEARPSIAAPDRRSIPIRGRAADLEVVVVRQADAP
jgi:adenylate cyclase